MNHNGKAVLIKMSDDDMRFITNHAAMFDNSFGDGFIVLVSFYQKHDTNLLQEIEFKDLPEQAKTWLTGFIKT